ncbi:hypothetical protein QIW53_26120 [Pseudomonas fluorescens]|uniref:hypothetical protein n=1 Tax=Pseudomonas fluorescens TaxID=294 RepID=UPI003525B9C8
MAGEPADRSSPARLLADQGIEVCLTFLRTQLAPQAHAPDIHGRSAGPAGKQTRKQKPTAHLAFQMSCFCDNAEGGFSPEPLLHINLWDEPTDVRHQNYMGFEMNGVSPRSLMRLQSGTARLFRWETGNGAADSWTYSLRLADINRLEGIRNYICTLIGTLLTNVDQGEAALDDTACVVRWSVLEDTQNYYRVVL